ncbi:aldo/keto reductase [Modestobacter sp. Leaf380]|uniref:aldo/keto reductase n=1 Tax=Modestobacter sp. Leaf380 TaxID=1736356 RepID=UPI0006FB829B|nr:aldo/keto reductase [Modestobacter sp. Leaf380]KQS68753.1 aldo/keto reductase [Modestobacter sp. Leaf380]
MTAVLGLGLAAVGRPAYITLGRDADLPGDRSPDLLRARAHELLDAAVDDLGIGYLDTARSYGRAEGFLGGWLAGRPDDPFVASKWGYTYTAEDPTVDADEVKTHDLPTLERQWAETRALLGDRLRLHQVHSLTVDSPLWDDEALLQRLAGIRDAGTELGFSTSGPRQADAVRRGTELQVGGARLFDTVQSTWNLLETSAGPALADAHAAGLRVVVKEGVANGRLTDRGLPADSPVRTAAAAAGVAPDAVALAAVLARPWVDVVLSGAVTVAQLRSNADARGLAVDLPDLAETPEAYWATRSALAWQ